MMYWVGFGGMWLGMAFMLLFWVGLILLVVWAVRGLFPRERRSEREVAIDVLRRRYAAGEISAAEYEQTLKAFGESAAIYAGTQREGAGK